MKKVLSWLLLTTSLGVISTISADQFKVLPSSQAVYFSFYNRNGKRVDSIKPEDYNRRTEGSSHGFSATHQRSVDVPADGSIQIVMSLKRTFPKNELPENADAFVLSDHGQGSFIKGLLDPNKRNVTITLFDMEDQAQGAQDAGPINPRNVKTLRQRIDELNRNMGTPEYRR